MRNLGDIKGSKRAVGPSQGVQEDTREPPRTHQRPTKDPLGIHQGSTKEAASKQLHIDMGPRAHQSKKELSTYNGRADCTLSNITPLTSNSFDLTRSGHNARRIWFAQQTLLTFPLELEKRLLSFKGWCRFRWPLPFVVRRSSLAATVQGTPAMLTEITILYLIYIVYITFL